MYFDNQKVSVNVKRSSKAVWVFAAAAALSGCGSLTIPQGDSDFDRRIYAGAGVVLSNLDPDASGVDGVSVDESQSSGAGLLLGYDRNDRLSLEGHIADLGEATFTPDGAITYEVAALSGIVYGFSDRQNRLNKQGLTAFGRLGVGLLNNNATGVRHKRVNDVHLLAGAGLEYGFNNGLAARLELIGHETDARYVQLALLYRFGDVTPAITQDATVTDIPADQSTTDLASDTSSDTPTGIDPASDDEQLTRLRGSAQLDSDLDGVTDDIDVCPETASGLPVDATGCELFDGAIEGVQFRVNSADLTDEAIVVLQEVAQALKDYPDINVTIEAHTDNGGDAQENLQLSRRRALAVARFLVDAGISGLRLRPQAFGESQPRASNATRAGRAANRRVEFTVFK